jgi:enamine deaminase RidA (YjgF/YER057c/UK114 family)
MPKQQIRSDKLRQPSGVFSHATMIEAKGRLVFISGMTARRADGSIAGVGDIEAQTRQVCENIKAAVEAAGGGMDDICRVDVYIRNMEQFDAIHKVRREYFREPLPASTMVEVVKMTHPDYLIEINAIAVSRTEPGQPRLQSRRRRPTVCAIPSRGHPRWKCMANAASPPRVRRFGPSSMTPRH